MPILPDFINNFLVNKILYKRKHMKKYKVLIVDDDNEISGLF